MLRARISTVGVTTQSSPASLVVVQAMTLATSQSPPPSPPPPSSLSFFEALKATSTRLLNMRKKYVGSDEAGNKYYTQIDGDGVERRSMKFAGLVDPSNIDPMWHRWLSKARKDPPTKEMMAARTAHLVSLAEKVKEVEAREQRERLEMLAESSGRHAMSSQDVDVIDEPLTKGKP